MKLTNSELDEILAKGGLRLNQPYSPRESYRKDEYLFTTCTECGVEAHYRLKYILDKNAQHERVCRACYWLAWYGGAHELYNSAVRAMIKKGVPRRVLMEQGVLDQPKGLGWDKASELAKKHGFELLDLITGEKESDEVMIVRCASCGKQTAERPSDIAFGCGCVKKGGVQYGKEAKKPSTSLDKRDIAPRTPGAASINSLIERRGENRSKYSYSDLEKLTVADFPDLLAAWDEDIPPETVSITRGGPAHFICPNGHHPNQSPYSYFMDGCMVCRGLATKAQPSGGLRASNPELTEEWLRAVDGDKYTPDNVKSGSKRKVIWRCMACGHEWEATVRSRELRMNNCCPECGKVMGSLAWKYPEVARAWSPNNPVSPWNIKPYSGLDFKPEWVCPDNPDHVWTCDVRTMLKKKGKCPFCNGKA